MASNRFAPDSAAAELQRLTQELNDAVLNLFDRRRAVEKQLAVFMLEEMVTGSAGSPQSCSPAGEARRSLTRPEEGAAPPKKGPQRYAGFFPPGVGEKEMGMR